MSTEQYPPLGNVVYFLQAGDDGPIKIGYSATANGVRKRVKDVQTGCPWHVVLRRMMKGSKYLERELHERFAMHRLAGEWFEPVPEVAEMAHANVTPIESTAHALVVAAYERGVKAGRTQGSVEEWDRFARIMSGLARQYGDRVVDETEYAVHLDNLVRIEGTIMGCDVGSEAA